MLAIWAKHTKIQCDSTKTCDTCTNVCMFFFSARRFRKFADKNEIFGIVGWCTFPNTTPDKNKPNHLKGFYSPELQVGIVITVIEMWQ